MNNSFFNENIIFNLLGFFIAPVILGIPGSLTYFIEYKYLGLEMQAEPAWMGIMELFLACLAGFTCIVLATRFLNLRKWQVIFLSVPIFLYSGSRCLAFQDDLISFLGYTCCREKASLISVLDTAFDPLAPFWQMLMDFFR